MTKQFLILVLALLPLSLMAREQEDADARPEKETKHSSGVFTGFSGGMMLHGGYLFANDPTKVFSNEGLGSFDYVKGLPKDGLCYGFGGALRVHLINHIHVGAEGFVSTMPLMKTGSNVRTGWGGAFCDVYCNWKKVRPLVGLTIGGGAMKRLYVPENDPTTVQRTDSTTTVYNSSYIKTPFFFIDPYVGVEIGLTKHIALLIRIDYMLPFNINSQGLSEAGKIIKWDNFVTPSGPRLYVGVMFGKLKKD